MKKSLGLIVASFFGVVMILSGCATTRNMMGAEYQKDLVSNSKTQFRNVWAVADEDGFRVSGKLRLKGSGGANTPKYVKVSFVDDAGKAIDSQKVVYYPKILRSKGNRREARFVARFDLAPPAGTVIRLENVN